MATPTNYDERTHGRGQHDIAPADISDEPHQPSFMEFTATTVVENRRLTELLSKNSNCRRMQQLLEMDTTRKWTENTEEQAEIHRIKEALHRYPRRLQIFNVDELKQVITNILTSTVENLVQIVFAIA